MAPLHAVRNIIIPHEHYSKLCSWLKLTSDEEEPSQGCRSRICGTGPTAVALPVVRIDCTLDGDLLGEENRKD